MGDRPTRIIKTGEHYGVPLRPYAHGQSRIKLVYCKTCAAYLPTHRCGEES